MSLAQLYAAGAGELKTERGGWGLVGRRMGERGGGGGARARAKRGWCVRWRGEVAGGVGVMVCERAWCVGFLIWGIYGVVMRGFLFFALGGDVEVDYIVEVWLFRCRVWLGVWANL